ncbi:transmembrane protein 276 isoform X1 [Dromaius novaehollandiae]|uniref:transmembrane protein 276 isoform X1 n=1 Tax=Dromaius novaehollandiae TaxID=8790 RepID=UPI00311DCA26
MAGEWGPALGNALLCAVSLRAALRTRQVNCGSAAGFLLQALAAAEALVAPRPPATAAAAATATPGAWACAVLAPPLLAFGFHWLNGDRATANLLLAAAVAAAAAGGRLAEEARVLAARSAAALAAGGLLVLAALTGSGGGALGGLLLGAGGLLWGLPPGALPLCPPAVARPWLLAAAGWALQRALGAQHRAWR